MTIVIPQFKYRGNGVLLFDPLVVIKPEMVELWDGARIDSFVKIEGGYGVSVGRFVHIASFAHIGIGGGQTILGDYSAVASGGKILSGSASVNGFTMSASAPRALQIVEYKKTVISRRAVVLTNAVIMPGITLGEGSVAAAGAVVTKDIPAWEVWGGVPAQKIGDRPNALQEASR